METPVHLETDLQRWVLDQGGQPLPESYAAEDMAGFRGGGVHGYRSLEGTFLGECIFNGHTAGRAIAQSTG
ncbi:hypothetical protein ASF71_07540 [Deinococcus sp. Leaf326]|nr:hypothetical protein ASF71_07540 [Deinococcus sp. Leaf326]